MRTVLLSAALAVPSVWTAPKTLFWGFTSNGNVLTRAESGDERRLSPELTVRDPASGRPKGVLVFPEAAGDVGRLLAVTPELGAAAWLNSAGDTLTVRSPARRWSSSIPGLRGARQLLFSPDGNTLAVTNENGYVQLWNVASGARRTTLLLRGRPDQLAFRPDSQVLAVNERFFRQGEGSVSLWNVPGGIRLGLVTGTRSVSRGGFAYAPDGKTLLLDVPRFTLGWVDPHSGQVLRQLPTFTEPCLQGSPFKTCAHSPFSASLSADGTRVALNVFPFANKNRPRVLIYDTSSLRVLKAVDLGRNVAALSPDGRTLLMQGYGPELLTGFPVSNSSRAKQGVFGQTKVRG